jgi:hypothetical protein
MPKKKKLSKLGPVSQLLSKKGILASIPVVSRFVRSSPRKAKSAVVF